MTSDLALLSNTRTSALVDRDGNISWFCPPAHDAPACFASLLGTEEHGHWRLRPADRADVSRRYLEDSLILETTYTTATGTVSVSDALLMDADHTRLVRMVEGRAGTVRMDSVLRVRFDYGSIVPWVRREGGDLRIVGGPDALVLRTPVPLHGHGYSTVGHLTVRAGELVPFELSWHPSHRAAPRAVDVAAGLRATWAWWRNWAAAITYDGGYAAEVRRSLTVLKGLTFAPTGALVAAPTTSLPETIGGTRNWDYRYCWLRDATLTLLGLVDAGLTEEARAWQRWLARTVAGDPRRLQIMYGVRGERRLHELELPWLPGHDGSRPVRIGNDAHRQLQLDVHGEVMDAMHHARLAGLAPEAEVWAIQQAMLADLEHRWHEPDEGVWEVRSGRRHFTHSKVMAWVAFDRAVRDATRWGLPGDVKRWRQVRDQIRAEVLHRAVDERGVFTQAYDTTALDSAALVIPLVGFLPPEDPRVAATINAVATGLDDHGFLLRYRPSVTSDGVDGTEGAFLLCSFWMAQSLAVMGRVEEAAEWFERLLAVRNDVGLLAEEYDPVAHRQLGNRPQAFSHVGLVTTAITVGHDRPGPAHRRSQR